MRRSPALLPGMPLRAPPLAATPSPPGQHGRLPRLPPVAPACALAGADCVKRPSDFCEKYGKRFLAEGTVHDARRPGRPRLVDPERAERAAELLLQGEGTGRREDGYPSVRRAVQRNPEIEALLMKGTPQQCSPRTLQRAAWRAKPYLGKVTVHMTPPLSQEHCQKRVEATKFYLRKWREDKSYFRWGGPGTDRMPSHAWPACRARPVSCRGPPRPALHSAVPSLTLCPPCPAYQCMRLSPGPPAPLHATLKCRPVRLQARVLAGCQEELPHPNGAASDWGQAAWLPPLPGPAHACRPRSKRSRRSRRWMHPPLAAA